MFGADSLFVLGTVELAFGYVVLAVLLLSLNLWAKLRWWIKASAIVVTSLFFFVTFISIRHLLGWPTAEEMPDQFEFVYGMVTEPNKATGEPGEIYVWLLPLPGDGTIAPEDFYKPGVVDTTIKPGQMPRAYIMPYDRGTHEEIIDAKTNIIEGARQIGVTTRKPKKPGEHAPQSQFMFFDRPDPILPPKGPDGGPSALLEPVELEPTD